MMKCDAPKRGRGVLSAHKGAAFLFTFQLRVFTRELCAHINTRWDDEVSGAPRRGQSVFSARAGATFIFTHQPACSLGKSERILEQCRMKRCHVPMQSQGAFLAQTAMHLF